ncbi:hypothetical protein BDR03DRAFT_938323 [Suillus americanus]|nr:hypothetical protein BDR03DRAFT_938323 [Suillus americanus]
MVHVSKLTNCILWLGQTASALSKPYPKHDLKARMIFLKRRGFFVFTPCSLAAVLAWKSLLC